MKEADPKYSHIMASDIQRDGMLLELWEGDTQIAEVFYSDQSHLMTLTAWKYELPLPIIEELIESAKKRLLPTRL